MISFDIKGSFKARIGEEMIKRDKKYNNEIEWNKRKNQYRYINIIIHSTFKSVKIWRIN